MANIPSNKRPIHIQQPVINYRAVANTPEPEQEFAVKVEHLTKVYGEIRAADDLSFSIRKGEIFGFVGPNGAGKTTTVECISGLRKPDSGTITILGMKQAENRQFLHEAVGVQIQESKLPPNLKVGEAMELFASFYRNPVDWKKLLEALELTGKAKTRFKRLSGGQKQRLSIALALVGNPSIAILDELTTGLDPEARRETWGLIERIRDNGVTVVLVTHFMDEAERLCDRVAVVVNGRIVILDSPQSIAEKYGGGTHVRFLPSIQVEDSAILSLEGVTSIERQGRRIAVTGTSNLPSQIIHELDRKGAKALELQTRSGDLEDAFVNIVRNAGTMHSG